MSTVNNTERDAVTVRPGTIAVFSDLWCSFAHVALHRLHATRRRLGLDHVVRFDHHAFPLELFNRAPSPRPGLPPSGQTPLDLEPKRPLELHRLPLGIDRTGELAALAGQLVASALNDDSPPCTAFLDHGGLPG